MVNRLLAQGALGQENAGMRSSFPWTTLTPKARTASLFALVSLAATLLGAGPSLGAEASSVVERGDGLYARGLLTDARAAYQEALGADPGSTPVLCRLAKVESELGEDAKGEEQRQLFAAAVEHARAAVRAAPDSAHCHVWLAVSLGRQAQKEGPKTRLALAREIKSEVDRAIALDPGLGRAYHVRGVWNRDIARLGIFERAMASTALGGIPRGATLENAVRDLQKAIELEPEYVNHRLELGRTYMIFHKKTEARRELEKAVSLSPTSSARDDRYQAEAKELLRKLPKR